MINEASEAAIVETVPIGQPANQLIAPRVYLHTSSGVIISGWIRGSNFEVYIEFIKAYSNLGWERNTGFDSIPGSLDIQLHSGELHFDVSFLEGQFSGPGNLVEKIAPTDVEWVRRHRR